MNLSHRLFVLHQKVFEIWKEFWKNKMLYSKMSWDKRFCETCEKDFLKQNNLSQYYLDENALF